MRACKTGSSPQRRITFLFIGHLSGCITSPPSYDPPTMFRPFSAHDAFGILARTGAGALITPADARGIRSS